MTYFTNMLALDGKICYHIKADLY